MEQVAPYKRWYERFKGALEALQSKQQQAQSPLPIIYQWRQPQPAHASSKYAPNTSTPAALYRPVCLPTHHLTAESSPHVNAGQMCA